MWGGFYRFSSFSSHTLSLSPFFLPIEFQVQLITHLGWFAEFAAKYIIVPKRSRQLADVRLPNASPRFFLSFFLLLLLLLLLLFFSPSPVFLLANRELVFIRAERKISFPGEISLHAARIRHRGENHLEESIFKNRVDRPFNRFKRIANARREERW